MKAVNLTKLPWVKAKNPDRLTLPLNHASDDELIVRIAWLYHVASFTQEEVASRLGLHRSRVNRLLSEARDRGVVSVTIHHESGRELDAEQAIVGRFGLDFCLTTPAIGVEIDAASDPAALRMHGLIARRAVGTAAASFLRGKLSRGTVKVGVSWGRTIEQVALQLSGVRNSQALFVSLLGSLTRNSASNPCEVVQALAARTGGEGHFLPVPFIADSAADRDVLMSQRSVAEALVLARSADLFLISVGELTETAFLRVQNMLSTEELQEIHARGAVCDTLGRLFDAAGREVEHELSRRTLAVDPQDLRGRHVVLVAGGLEKIAAIAGLLGARLVVGLITDGDTGARSRNRTRVGAPDAPETGSPTHHRCLTSTRTSNLPMISMPRITTCSYGPASATVRLPIGTSRPSRRSAVRQAGVELGPQDRVRRSSKSPLGGGSRS